MKTATENNILYYNCKIREETTTISSTVHIIRKSRLMDLKMQVTCWSQVEKKLTTCTILTIDNNYKSAFVE